MKQTIIKAMTLLSFTGLLTAFVLYRAGVLENVFQSSPNGGKMPGIAALSPQSDSAKAMQIMPSSKSIGVFPTSKTTGKDSTKSFKDSNKIHTTNSFNTVAASSKSMTPIITNPEHFLVNLDSVINKPNQQNDSHKLKESQIMSSSKSARTIEIQDINLILSKIDSMMKTDSSKIKSKKTPATKTPKK